ncbi:hypothetical protein KKF81_05540 [Candidatus Micrarchaeota archaeon]|nr:hypothetical protein [Candidatus Micrarchaeota archaeon]MBU1166391.1 hypothetical protein [Candidatus Micrarchaeota archaeon]MBU1887177.1 hypothetical protein [Candidatus Micrarchaeota archaeon]
MALKQSILAIAFIIALELVLVLLGIIPPLTELVPIHLSFSLAVIFIIGYSGWSVGNTKLGAKHGAILALLSSVLLAAGVVVGTSFNLPVLGVSVGSSVDVLALLISNTLVNIFLAAGIGALTGFARAKINTTTARSPDKILGTSPNKPNGYNTRKYKKS